MASIAHSIGGAKWVRAASLCESKGQAKPMRMALERWVGLDHRRTLPAFAVPTLVHAAAKLGTHLPRQKAMKAVLFADVFTNYGLAHRGVATLEVLRALGADVVVSEAVPDGRASLSQGMISTAKVHARRVTAELDRYVSEGRDIVVVEPSSLAMFRRDLRHLLDSKDRFERFRSRAFDPVEYVLRILEGSSRKPKDVFDVSRSKVGQKVFYHAHCQQKTIGCAEPTEKLLREIGFDVLTTTVECCGMAGSFGYKTDYYDLSMAVASDLFTQIIQQERSGGKRALVASGTSCTEQIQGGFARDVLHPMELLASVLRR